MAHLLGELLLLMLISASFGQDTGPLLADFIDFLYTTTLSPKSCGVQRQCVPFYNCKVVDLDDTICGYPDTCCNIADKKTTQEPAKPTAGAKQYGACGYRNVEWDKSGSESDFGEFPWLVALMSGKEAVPGSFFCSGAIIAPTVVLTTGYCVRTPTENFFIQPGEWIRMDNSKIQHRARRVDKVIKHEKFDETALIYNLALLIVDRPFEWEENVRPVCLPEADISYSETGCFAPSWTKDKPHKTDSQAILKKLNWPVVPKDQCLEKYRPYVSDTFSFHATTICAGGKPRRDYDIFNSAVPLVCTMPGEKDRYFLAGLESFIQKEKDLQDNKYVAPSTPRANVNVPLLRQWIKEKLAENFITVGQ